MKSRPAALLSQRIHLRHLIGVGIGDADIPRLACTDGLVHALQNLLCWCLVVPDVVDVQIDIVHAEVLQAAVDVVQHMLPAIYAVRDFLLRARQALGFAALFAKNFVATTTFSRRPMSFSALPTNCSDVPN